MPWDAEYKWVTGETPPTSTEVRRAGDRIRKAHDAGREPLPEDVFLLNRFRAWHQPILYPLQERLSSVLRDVGIVSPVVGRPLKTQTAIIRKLVREKSRLNRMQDIAGTRVVVPDLRLQEIALAASLLEFAEHDPRVTDTRVDGDVNGYRGLHVILLLEGRYAEIQLRTPHQALWAQLVETLDEVGGTDLKHGVGPDDVRMWLKQFSERLGRVERGEEALKGDLAIQSLAAMLISTVGEWSKRRPLSP